LTSISASVSASVGASCSRKRTTAGLSSEEATGNSKSSSLSTNSIRAPRSETLITTFLAILATPGSLAARLSIFSIEPLTFAANRLERPPCVPCGKMSTGMGGLEPAGRPSVSEPPGMVPVRKYSAIVSFEA
jgi:hypothetical protein